MKDDPSNLPITLRQNETKPITLVYRPRDRDLDPYDLTGKAVEMRIRPGGGAEEIVYTEPEISITDDTGGEITIEIPGDTVAAYTFQNAPYVVLLDDQRLIHGVITVKSLYE